MVKRVEVAIKPEFTDARGESVLKGIKSDLGIIGVEAVRVVDTYKIDNEFPEDSLDFLGRELFADPITQDFTFDEPLAERYRDYNWIIEVALKPGVMDTVGKTSSSAIEELTGEGADVYVSRQYMIKGNVSREQMERIAKDLLANAVVEDWSLTERGSFTRDTYLPIPKVLIPHEPTMHYIGLDISDEELMRISGERSLALNLNEMLAIKEYFSRPEVIESRTVMGFDATPTDAELEVLAQTWSEHCKHKIFNAKVRYVDENGEETEIDSLFNTYIKRSTKQLQEKLPWIVSVLWDNSGVVKFNDDWDYCFKCETHNQPSNKGPFGGAATGIVGVYRDPMGTGMGCKLIWGDYGFCTGDPDYDGELRPELHPRRLLAGVRSGVEEANKHGVPTPYGFTFFDDGFMGKCGIYVTAGGLIPAKVAGEPGHKKHVDKGDKIVMVGGRVGIDGIHGATESSMEAGEWITMGHVQMANPFQSKIMHDFLNEARDKGLYNFIQDNGAGGLSSSVGETASFSNGCYMDLEKVPLKYQGLDPWQILLSESQERMTLAVPRDKIEKFMELARVHDVESTILGEFNDSGKFHVVYGEKPVAYLDMDFLHEGVPQMELTARWITPEERGLSEPELKPVKNHGEFLKQILSRPNICSKEYIVRQYDHEVQGTSVVKHMVGKDSDVHSDGAVIRPLLDSDEGIAITAGINPKYSQIDTYHMTAMAIDEAIRKALAVGGSLEQLPLNDNFIWPSPLPSEKNPDAEYKMAQLVRANQALYDHTMEFETPCISGKDSMSMDGELDVVDSQGERIGKRRVSALPTVKFSAAGKVDDIRKCITMDVKKPDDLIYVLGTTKDELGGSEYYEMFGEIGLNVPRVDAGTNKKLYQAFSQAVKDGLISSAHGCYKGGLAITLAQSSFAGGFGMDIDLKRVPREGIDRDDKVLYSESAGRFVVTVSPENRERFEEIMEGSVYGYVGNVSKGKYFRVRGEGGVIIEEDAGDLKKAWKSPYADR